MARRAAAAAKAAQAGVIGSNYPVITDQAAIDAVNEYAQLQAEKKKADARMKVLKPAILKHMEGAPRAVFGMRIVTAQPVDEIPATENVQITAAMVGQIIPGSSGRAGYTTLTVK